jgi:hypothetical protein
MFSIVSSKKRREGGKEEGWKDERKESYLKPLGTYKELINFELGCRKTSQRDVCLRSLGSQTTLLNFY